jgi:GNAT superfamily N-acetyltransferase
LSNYGDPERLGPDHVLHGFDSGERSLDTWLLRHARSASAAGSAQTFVIVGRRQERVVGYYALTVASVEHADVTARARKGMPAHPIPTVLLARLAVDRSAQGEGLGAWLLQDAMRRALAAAENMGIRALLVHALHASARGFYERFGFEPSPTDPLNLQLLIKDIRRSLDAA